MRAGFRRATPCQALQLRKQAWVSELTRCLNLEIADRRLNQQLAYSLQDSRITASGEADKSFSGCVGIRIG